MKSEWERKFTKGSAHYWTLRTDCFSIAILNDHRDYIGRWVMHCFILGIDTKILNASSIEEAKAESIKIVRDVVKKYSEDIAKICGEEQKHRKLNGG